MADRDGLRARLDAALGRIVVGVAGQDAVMDPAILDVARQLAETAESTDIPTWCAIGTLHWWRYRHTWRSGDEHDDLGAALAAFETVWQAAPELLPDAFRRAFAGDDQGAARDEPGAAEPPASHDGAHGLVERRPERPEGSHIDLTVGWLRQAVASTAAGLPERARCLAALGRVLAERFERTGIAEDLDEAVAVARASVDACAAGHPDRVAYLSLLGELLVTRFQRTAVMSDIDESVTVGRAARAVAPIDHPLRPTVLHNLGGALRLKFDRTGVLADIDEAVIVGRAAVDAIPADDPDLALFRSNLGVTLRIRFERTGNLADLDEAVALGRAAASTTPIDGPDLAWHLSNLALALRIRFNRNGALTDVDEAVSVGRRAVDVTPAGHQDRAGRLSNLSIMLWDRFDRTNELADIDDSVAFGRAAAAATAIDHPMRGGRLANLGVALRTRFERTGTREDIDEAVVVGRQAEAAAAGDQMARAVCLTDLGLALRVRFQSIGVLVDADEAVSVSRQVLSMTPADHPMRAGRLSNLGLALRARFESTGSPADRDEAASWFLEGLRVATAEPVIRMYCGRSAARMYAASAQWPQAWQAMETVLELAALVADRALGRADRQHRVEQAQGLGPQAARAALDGSPAATGGADGTGRAQAAWMALEAGRGVLLGQALEARSGTAELRRSRIDLADEFEEIRRVLSPRSGRDDATSDEPDAALLRRTRAASRWPQLLAEIREVEGFERFALPPTSSDMRHAAGDGTIVAVNVTVHGSGALLLSEREVGYLALPGLSAQEADDRASTFLEAVTDERPDPRTIRRGLSWLWDVAAGPVLEHLGYGQACQSAQLADWPRVYWILTGPLSVLPIHAAGHLDDGLDDPRRRCVLDRVVSSYTPTVRVLEIARKRAARPRTGGVLALGINEAADAKPLARAEDEAISVHRLLGATDHATLLLGSDATHDAVRAGLPAASWSHFACHAYADSDDPSRSLLSLVDQPLHVAELDGLNLPHAYLAYLSACTTARGSSRLPDESIHIASAFQLAGYPHVIATLWPIRDRHASALACDVYRAINDGLDPALGVHQSVRGYRDRGHNRDHAHVWASHVHFGP